MPDEILDSMVASPATAACPLYEQDLLRQATGKTLRPGGIDLTDRLLACCELPQKARLLDIGCGCGATLDWLRKTTNHRPYGVDYSVKLLREAATHRLSITQGVAGCLPFSEAGFDAVMLECSLSVIASQGCIGFDSAGLAIQSVLKEAQRVLVSKGWLLLSDLYARRVEGIPGLRALPRSSCLRGALDMTTLQNSLEASGFEICFWEDHSNTLRQLNSKLCQTYGSTQSFWDQATGESTDSFDLVIRIARAKPGYFILLARKV